MYGRNTTAVRIETTGMGATGGGTATSFTAEFTPAAESADGPVYYRLKVTAGSKTLYSDIITVEYTATEYQFKEDFGGSWPSTDSTNQAGASGDWWDDNRFTTNHNNGF